MLSDIPAPGTDPQLIAALRRDLEAASFRVETVEELMGSLAAAALRREDPIPARLALRAREEAAARLFRLFVLGEDLTRAEVEAALPCLGAHGAEALGLLGAAGAPDSARALVTLSPYSALDDLGEISWWIASDLSELATGAPLGPEHVLGVGGASLTLARITPREQVGSVLDVGCGGGIQALHAARHAERVVATDLSARALAFAAFNAALNGAELELRQGSLLEPAGQERFDLIVSNPPFVITPRTQASASWTYRDGGRPGDALVGELLAGIPEHLAPDGRAVMLGNWEISADESDRAWSAHPEAWLRPALDSGIDAWVIQRDREDPAAYAATWARDGGITPRDAAWEPMITAWLEDFAGRGVEAIGFGYILLHRPEDPERDRPERDRPERERPDGPMARAGALRCEEATGSGSGTLSEHLARSLTAIGALAQLDDEALLASRPVREQDVVERRHLVPGAWDPMLIELVQGAGLARTVVADQVLAATVGALDGELTLAQVLAAVCALTGDDLEEARSRALPRIRDLLVAGMLRL